MQKKLVKRSMDAHQKSTLMTSLEKISVSLNESMCVSDGSNGRDGGYGGNGRNGRNVRDDSDGRYGSYGLYACVSRMAKMVHMFVCLCGLFVLDGLSGAIQPFSVGMYS